ncbi:Uncharacterised protein [Streptococcus pneumoniae]|uniref:TRAG family protein n=1 Tax=Bacillus cereus group sp. Bc010 TaxID=3018125 RepID=UPI0005DFF422|nr:TRAG family protein [Bacillus cereus group sp. Bc010]MCU5059157.1 TRAG family protein [Bacillus cereus]COF41310.1 Uncharacterised protein [Streptococcus pneumoniae]MDA2771133.1 TRAG family protein [Bacillus cereus group sp. Bc010]COQ13479.1 Uncharacterised protein [Streptococcus pneumoniae]COS43932.1 Uncharacterised protein [Streptococcus pneumoniae]
MLGINLGNVKQSPINPFDIKDKYKIEKLDLKNIHEAKTLDIKNICETKKNHVFLGKAGKGTGYRIGDLISKELMQAISIAQTVIKPIKQHDYCIEYATKLLAGSILYLNHRHKDLYYLDVKKAIEFTEKLYESGANLVEVVDSLKKEHPAHHIFQELGYHSEETRDTIIVTLLYNLEKYQREKLNPEREYFWFQ